MNDWQTAQYLNLSTRKRDGSHVDTPVWFAFEEGIFYLFSEGKAGKVKRIRNFSNVRICPCTVTGKLTGEWQEGEAWLIDNDADKTLAHAALVRKYGWQMRLLDLGATLAGKKAKRAFIRLSLKDPKKA